MESNIAGGPNPQLAAAAGPQSARRRALRRALWRGKIGPAFWTVAGSLSLATNLALIVFLLLAGQHLFAVKKLITQQLIGGLYYNFVRMDRARITTEIQVQDTIHVSDSMPVVFDLQLDQKTQVVLTEDTPVKNATIFLNGQPVPIDIILRAGTPLNIQLKMSVPVNQTIPVELDVPVNLTVPVDIPLNQTELHEPFAGLQDVVSPYYWLLWRLPDSWSETIPCNAGMGGSCAWLAGGE